MERSSGGRRQLRKLDSLDAGERPPRPLEAGQPVLDVGRVPGLARLTVADHAHPDRELAGHNVRDRQLNPLLERSLVDLLAGLPVGDQLVQIGRPGQASGVRGQNAVATPSHAPAPFSTERQRG
jgi:hypothetical protein